MLDVISMGRLELVHPALAAKIITLDSMLTSMGGLRVAQGFRTFAEQDALYAQGRTAPGKIVTDAPGGYSWHCFGLAVDCYPNNPDGSIDWNPDHPDWKQMEASGQKLGMVSGATWKRIVDAPHFQLIGSLISEDEPAASTRALYNLAGRGEAGIREIWLASGLWISGNGAQHLTENLTDGG